MSSLVQEKVQQAIQILNEKNLDCWLTFVRETPAGGDPVLPLIYGHDLTWQSALIITNRGDTFAIVGNYDAETARLTGAYENVIPYQHSLRRSLLHTLERVYPAKIAVNYSKNDVQADGLSHGLYQLLLDYFTATPWEQRLVSAESIIGALRGRKIPAEVARVRSAVETTRKIFDRTFEHIHPGITEAQIHQYMVNLMEEFEVEAAWELQNCPIVNIGPESPVGHVGPTMIQLQRGQLVHIDFGVRQDVSRRARGLVVTRDFAAWQLWTSVCYLSNSRPRGETPSAFSRLPSYFRLLSSDF